MTEVISPKAFSIKKLTPILIVDDVETCVQFWVDRLGFKAETMVPGGDGKVAFAILDRDGIEVMYQSRASVIADRPTAEADLVGHSTALFFEVKNLAAIEEAIAGVEIVKPTHKTPYGSTEIYVLEPGGNTVGFAEFA